MQSLLEFFGTPQGRDVLATLGILVASELHGWGKGGSLTQSGMGYLAAFCAKFSTPAHQALVAEVLKVQGVQDLAAPVEATPPATPPQA